MHRIMSRSTCSIGDFCVTAKSWLAKDPDFESHAWIAPRSSPTTLSAVASLGTEYSVIGRYSTYSQPAYPTLVTACSPNAISRPLAEGGVRRSQVWVDPSRIPFQGVRVSRCGESVTRTREMTSR